MANLQEAKTIMKIMVTAVVVAVASVFVLGVKREVPSAPPKHQPCPKSCMCFPRQRDNALELQCGDKSLSSVPTITDNDILISVLNLSFNPLNTLTLLGYQSAEDVYLQDCQLITIDEKVFNGFKNLKFVDLSNNLLTSIPPDLFADNHLLEKLILQNNFLQDIDPNTPFLNGPASLRSLDLQSCKLSTLSSVTFSSLPNLRNLDISRNQLIVLDSDYLHFLHELESIILKGNPLKCGNKFEDMVCWIQRKLVAFRNETLQCQHVNKTWDTWPPDRQISFCCDSCKTPTLPQVCKPDVTETTTVNLRVSWPQEICNSWWCPSFSIAISVIFVAVCICVPVFICLAVYICVCAHRFTKTWSSLRDRQLHSEERLIASED
ncbi:SLIT and NTRK-like protein 4 [Cryptotermes secundus]|uniref:SLIT and NTRK-like protein 4 n=1 Tax=Cryptotermes secundus TaxID=105785 RepID=UPI001454CC7A|nr:SLIT and NTRK-like protein 4 [Cryptotermes secundus]